MIWTSAASVIVAVQLAAPAAEISHYTAIVVVFTALRSVLSKFPIPFPFVVNSSVNPMCKECRLTACRDETGFDCRECKFLAFDGLLLELRSHQQQIFQQQSIIDQLRLENLQLRSRDLIP